MLISRKLYEETTLEERMAMLKALPRNYSTFSSQISLGAAKRDFLRFLNTTFNKEDFNRRLGNRCCDYFTRQLRLETVFKKHPKFSQFLQEGIFFDNGIKRLLTDKFYEPVRKRCVTKAHICHYFRYNHKASNHFPAGLLKFLINEYNIEYVLDLFAGWGTRMLGCHGSINCKGYIGVDTNKELVQKLQSLHTFLNQFRPLPVTLINAPIETVPFCDLQFDLILVSPPYGLTERYEGFPYRTEVEFLNTCWIPLLKSLKSLKSVVIAILLKHNAMEELMLEHLGLPLESFLYKTKKFVGRNSVKTDETVYIYNIK